MGLKTLELTVISAKDLKNVNLIGKMDVYTVVQLSDEPKTKQKTPVHQDSGTKPTWNYTMRFTIDEAAAKPGKYLVFQLKHEHTFGADKDLGEVLVPLRELFDTVNAKDPSASQFVTYQVRTSSGKAKGELKFSFKIIDQGYNNTPYSTSSYKPANSCSSSSSSSGYPPSAPSAGVPYPPPAGYPAPQKASASAAAPYPPQAAAPYPPQAAAYPPPHQAPAGAYPPPQQGYPPQQVPTGVPYAAPQGYPPYGGYPPQPAGYGYPPSGGYPPQGGGGYPQYPPAGYAQQPQKPQKPKKSGGGFGMGMGAGLLGGAIGGLVLGEVLDDAFDDGGFDGGFDF